MLFCERGLRWSVEGSMTRHHGALRPTWSCSEADIDGCG